MIDFSAEVCYNVNIRHEEVGIMKKYYIADALTTMEVIFAVAILVLTWVRATDAGLVLILFSLGELCDAFDGMAARRWRYPQDGKKRWWRTYAVRIDQFSDIFLGLSVLLFIIVHLDTNFGLLVLGVSSVVGFGVELLVYNYLYEKNADLALLVVLARRYLYLFGIGACIVRLLFSAGWDYRIKMAVIFVAVIVAVILWFVKVDRRTQDKTL